MTTLAIMKARIEAETLRSDLTANGAIASEIESAIKFYRSHRFWFSEKRTRADFNTVIGQSEYTATDQSDIPNLIRIDSISITDDGKAHAMRLASPLEIELMIQSSTSLANVPVHYSYYAQVLRFYPIPDKVLPVRIMGVFQVASPATDSETNNPWMNEAEELIRARAKRNLYLNWMLGTENSQVVAMKSFEDEALDRLKQENSSRNQTARIRGTW